MQAVVKKKIIKWLDVGFIYSILDSTWVSLVNYVPKNVGVIEVPNERNKLVPVRPMTG